MGGQYRQTILITDREYAFWNGIPIPAPHEDDYWNS